MTREEAVQQYVAVKPERKCRFLLSLSALLTISARSYTTDNVEDVVARKALTGFNEVQHNIAEEALHYLIGTEERYPDDVLMNILIGKANAYGIDSHLRYAVEKLLSREE